MSMFWVQTPQQWRKEPHQSSQSQVPGLLIPTWTPGDSLCPWFLHLKSLPPVTTWRENVRSVSMGVSIAESKVPRIAVALAGGQVRTWRWVQPHQRRVDDNNSNHPATGPSCPFLGYIWNLHPRSRQRKKWRRPVRSKPSWEQREQHGVKPSVAKGFLPKKAPLHVTVPVRGLENRLFQHRHFWMGWGKWRAQRADGIASSIAFTESWRNFYHQQPLIHFTENSFSHHHIFNYPEKPLFWRNCHWCAWYPEGGQPCKGLLHQPRASGRALTRGRQKLWVKHTQSPCCSPPRESREGAWIHQDGPWPNAPSPSALPELSRWQRQTDVSTSHVPLSCRSPVPTSKLFKQK